LVIERVAIFIKHLGTSVNAFEKSIGTRSTIANAIKNKTDIGVSWISKIFEVYPEINPTWLLTGKGGMLLAYEQINLLKEPELNYGKEMTLESINKLTIYLKENNKALKKISPLYKSYEENKIEKGVTKKLLAYLKEGKLTL